MEELKMLVEMVAKLPALAIWVLVMFWAYKVVMVGSIYGLIRFVVLKLHDYLIKQKHHVKTVELRPLIDGMCISGQLEPMMVQLRRVAGRATSIRTDERTNFFHSCTVEWLRDAIDDKIAKDAAEGNKP